MSDKLEKLKEMLKLLQDDTVKPSTIRQFLELVLGTIKKSKENFEEISKENLKDIQNAIEYISKEHSDILNKVAAEKTTFKKDFETKLAEVKRLIRQVQAIEVRDGIDGVDGIDGKDGKDGKDGSPDTRQEIVEKINTGKKKDLKIELEQIEGTAKFEKGILDRAVSILDQRTQFLINKNVAHDGTLTGTGSSSNPLSVTLALNDLTDVIAANPSTGQVLTWNGANWINDNVSGGSGGGATLFKALTPDEDGTYPLLQGAIDGANTLFTVPEGQYITGTLTVWLNGVVVDPGTGSDEWQETDPVTGTFTFNTAPQASTNDSVYVEYNTTAGGGGGNAAGADTQVQFNDGGALNGDPTFTFNKTTNVLTVASIIGNSFVPNLSTIPSNGMYLPAANTLGWAINSAAELQLTSTALLPATDDGLALGSIANNFSDLFLATGAVINYANGNVVVTHSSGVLSMDTGEMQIASAGTDSRSVVTNSATQTLANKTLTAPKFADLGFIADANGNELFIFDTVTSAVNEITFANAATGTNPTFSATGGDSNIGINFQVKGTGVYRFLATASGPTDIRLFEDTDNGTNYVSLIAPATLAGDVVLTLPSTTGTVALLGGNVFTGVQDAGGATSFEIPNGAGGTTVDATGEVTIDSTSKTLNFYDGAVEAVLTPIQSKSITIESPGAAEDVSMFYTDDAITITKMVFVITGSTSATTTIRHHTDRSNAGNEVVTGGTTANSTTTGNVVTSFNDATVPADSFIWLETTALSGTPTSLNVTIFYRQDA